MCIIDYLLIAAIVLVITVTTGVALYYRQRCRILSEDTITIVDRSVFL